MDDLARRTLRARAANAVDHTRSLAAREPAWGSEIHRLAGGWLVLAGAGMYLNQALAAGVDEPLTTPDLDLLQARSDALGVTPAFEVTLSTLPETVDRLRERGYLHDPDADITALARSVAGPPVDAPDDVTLRPVETAEAFRLWQETSAAGWGHANRDARRTADAFAAAANALDHEHMVIGFDSSDDRPIGCASMTVREGVAMLGGMSTLPAERRRGVQAALVRYRLALAHRLGCDLATSTAASGSASERNLQRHGFAPTATIQAFTLSPTLAG